MFLWILWATLGKLIKFKKSKNGNILIDINMTKRYHAQANSKLEILNKFGIFFLIYFHCNMLKSVVYIAKWFSYIFNYIFIYIPFYIFSFMFITGYWIQFPLLYAGTLLFIHPMYASLHQLVLSSQSFLPHPPFLGKHKSVLCVCESLFCFAGMFIWVIFQIPHISDVI